MNVRRYGFKCVFIDSVCSNFGSENVLFYGFFEKVKSKFGVLFRTGKVPYNVFPNGDKAYFLSNR